MFVVQSKCMLQNKNTFGTWYEKRIKFMWVWKSRELVFVVYYLKSVVVWSWAQDLMFTLTCGCFREHSMMWTKCTIWLLVCSSLCHLLVPVDTTVFLLFLRSVLALYCTVLYWFMILLSDNINTRVVRFYRTCVCNSSC